MRTNGVWYQKHQIIFCHCNLRILESHKDFTQVQVHWPTEICLFESDFYVRCNSYIIHYWQWASDILWHTFAQSCCMTSEHLCCEHIVYNFFYDTVLIFYPFLRIGHFHRHPIHFVLYGQHGKDILQKSPHVSPKKRARHKIMIKH